MSTKSTHGKALVPDMPVTTHSPLLESYFESLHQKLCQALAIPEKIEQVAHLCDDLKRLYYLIRNELEADHGIDRLVVESLPLPDIGPALKELYFWESTDKGRTEYERRLDPNGARPFSGAEECWNNFRMILFESHRILNITRGRVAKPSKNAEPRRYPWLSDPNLMFDK